MNASRKISMYDGTFDICQNCPTSTNCCTRLKTFGEIDNAITFSEEIIEIENYTGQKRQDFLQIGRYPEDHPFQTIKHEDGIGCHFNKGGQCQIYSVRPLDCRLFPFDIVEKPNGDLIWIVYTKLCPDEFDYRPSFEKLKRFFDLPESMARAYARANAPGMENQPHIELDLIYEGCSDYGSDPRNHASHAAAS